MIALVEFVAICRARKMEHFLPLQLDFCLLREHNRIPWTRSKLENFWTPILHYTSAIISKTLFLSIISWRREKRGEKLEKRRIQRNFREFRENKREEINQSSWRRVAYVSLHKPHREIVYPPCTFPLVSLYMADSRLPNMFPETLSMTVSRHHFNTSFDYLKNRRLT